MAGRAGYRIVALGQGAPRSAGVGGNQVAARSGWRQEATPRRPGPLVSDVTVASVPETPLGCAEHFNVALVENDRGAEAVTCMLLRLQIESSWRALNPGPLDPQVPGCGRCAPGRT